MQHLDKWYKALVVGKEKAVVGGAVSGALSLLALVGITGEMTVKEVLISAVNWVLTHVAIWFKANTKKK